MKQRIAIVGAGLVGSLLSIFLARRGLQVDVYERRADLRGRDLAPGRSINLTLCTRGFRALRAAGVEREIRELTVPARGRVMHDERGETTFQPYGNRGEAIHSVSRNDLNRVLIDLAERRHSVRFHFEHELLDLDLEAPALELRCRRTGRVRRETADAVLGADGAYSSVRRRFQDSGRLDLSQHYVDQAYKEIPLPAGPGGEWQLEANALHIWPRGRYMLIGFPNVDGSFTLALHLPFEGDPSFASVRDEAALRRLFEASFPDVLPRLPDLPERFFGIPETSMVTVCCAPWVRNGRVALVGDAAHAIVPSYGQGANCGFEDCAVLDRCLDATGGDWRAALERYERCRKPNADAIADLSLEHFRELQHLVADPRFLLRKAVERRINELFPDRYQPLYSMISFTDLSYVEALEIERCQRELVDRIVEIDGIEEMLAAGGADCRIAELVAQAGALEVRAQG